MGKAKTIWNQNVAQVPGHSQHVHAVMVLTGYLRQYHTYERHRRRVDDIIQKLEQRYTEVPGGTTR